MINGKYWIDTDPFINIEKLKEIEFDIIKGLCMTIPYHKIVVYGQNVFKRTSYPAAKAALMESNDKAGRAFKELNETMVRLGRDAIRIREADILFTKLTHDVYSGGKSVILRLEDEYANKNLTDHCKNTPESSAFSSLLLYAWSLPFTEVGRILIFLNDHGLMTPVHTDGGPSPSHHNEFIWVSIDKTKQFFIYDPVTDQKHYVTSHSAFFNEQDYHGSDPAPAMNFSIRIDGVFTDEFREKLGIAHINNYNSKD